MSWQDLVNNNLLGTGNVSKAAICGLDGSIWGKSDNFNITEAEAVAAGKGFQQQDALLGTGLRFEGEKFFVLQADEERIIGKKASSGFFIYKTAQAVIIGIYEGGVQPEMCSKTTGALADYFKTINY
uniref:Profilin n=1 Tax=Ditylenchus dipsaci TaxID=166011 RepID=A0A915DF42_9BILA